MSERLSPEARICDTLATLKCMTRPEYCQLKGLDGLECGGPSQWQHVVSRNTRQLRWVEYNCIKGCRNHHAKYTWHQFEWIELIRKNFPQQYQLIQMHINDKWSNDSYPAVMQRLSRGLSRDDIQKSLTRELWATYLKLTGEKDV
jgi:hypothetical protein